MAIGVKGIQSERLRRRQEQQDSVTNGHVEREEPRLFTETESTRGEAGSGRNRVSSF